nr:magnetosome protein MamI-3 [Desulfobacteraceae bacterium]
MDEKIISLSNRTIWILVAIVFMSVLFAVFTVFTHDKVKPNSPQALVATAFNQLFTVQEWKPGMGQKPFLYHPAAFTEPAWQPLPNGILNNQSMPMVDSNQSPIQWQPINSNPNLIRK